MTTKFGLTNYGPAGKELLVLLVNQDHDAHPAVVKRTIVGHQQIIQVLLEPEQVLVIRPLTGVGRTPLPIFTPSQLQELRHVADLDPGDRLDPDAGGRDPGLAP